MTNNNRKEEILFIASVIIFTGFVTFLFCIFYQWTYFNPVMDSFRFKIEKKEEAFKESMSGFEYDALKREEIIINSIHNQESALVEDRRLIKILCDRSKPCYRYRDKREKKLEDVGIKDGKVNP